MRLRQALVAVLVVVLLLGRPAAVDASWAGMLVQVTAMLSQIRSYVQTAEAYVAQAGAEVRGLLDPGGLVSGVRSLADWRGLLSELTDAGPLWEPFPETRALVDDAVLSYQAARGLGAYDFGSVAGFVDFLDFLEGFWRLRVKVDSNLTRPDLFHRDLGRLARCRRDGWPRADLELAGAPSGGNDKAVDALLLVVRDKPRLIGRFLPILATWC